MAQSTVDYAALLSRIRELEGSVLTEIAYRTEERTLQLRFKHWDGKSLAVLCSAVVLCNVSVVDQNAVDPEVIGAHLEAVECGGSELLEKTGYLWDTKRAQAENFSYPLVHLSLDGDTCVAVVCGSIDLQ
jgi:hypothetical protein